MPKNFNYGMISNFKLLKEIVRDFDIFINPTILSSSEEVKDDYEYCLSVDTNEYLVRRPAKVQVQYYEEDGILKTEVLDGLRARIFQHEYDHLEGRLISEIGTLVPRDVVSKPGREVRRGSRRRLENML
jgi:peptide deformylase